MVMAALLGIPCFGLVNYDHSLSDEFGVLALLLSLILWPRPPFSQASRATANALFCESTMVVNQISGCLQIRHIKWTLFGCPEYIYIYIYMYIYIYIYTVMITNKHKKKQKQVAHAPGDLTGWRVLSGASGSGKQDLDSRSARAAFCSVETVCAYSCVSR